MRNLTPYHHGDLRRALLEAGLRVLEAEGAERLGLRELARQLGVSPTAPYRHFDSLLALLEALAVSGFQQFAKAMTQAIQAEPEDTLRAMGRAYVAFALEHPNLFRLMFSPTIKRDGRPNVRMAADAAFASLKAVTQTGGPEGRFAALSAWSKVHGLAVLLLDGQIAIGTGETVSEIVTAVIAAP